HHRRRDHVIEDALEQAPTALRVGHDLGVKAVSLGGEMDDLLVDVAESETFRNAAADVVPAGAGCMRNRHDTRLRHFIFSRSGPASYARHRTLLRAALKDQEPTDVSHDMHAACRVTKSGAQRSPTPPTPPAASACYGLALPTFPPLR